MTKLFTPIKLGAQTLNNRIIIPAMCQYSAIEGKPTSWHTMHYGALSHSGAGLLTFEATAVCPEGRISPYDLGLWNDETCIAMQKLLRSIHNFSAMPLAVQLAHAGRKASMQKPWKETAHVPSTQGGWKTVAPSAIAFAPNYDMPKELSVTEIKTIIKQFSNAAKYADDAGFDMVEIHAAHGYLLHQFLSPLSNQRTDQYGGSVENRIRLVLEVFNAVREILPTEKAVGVRISASDWMDNGWDLEQSLILADALKKLNCSFIHVSSGGLHIDQKIKVGPNYQVPFAQIIKEQVDMPTIAVGLITEAEQAEAIVSTEQADMVAIGRALLFNPHWPWEVAAKLGEKIIAPPQYLRSKPHHYPNLFK